MPKEYDKEYYKWFVATDFCHVIPKMPGCYAIYLFDLETKKWELFYIGTSKNLSLRLRKHPVARTLRALSDFPKVVAVKCKIITNETNRLQTEKKLIERLSPRVNYE